MPRRILALVVVLLAVSACGSGKTTAHPPAPRSTTAASEAPQYLALGDSVSFGYRELSSVPRPNFFNATSFVGFPELVAKDRGLQLTNAACPGETTASFTMAGGASFGCESTAGGGPGYRTAFPLHVQYQGPQLAFAISFLKAHPATKLVTLMIGANDGFLCKAITKDKCVTEVGGVFAAVEKNVAAILSALRAQGGYTGTIAVVEYYSTNYTSALTTALSEGLNSSIAAGAQPYHVTLVDGLTAFKVASMPAGGATCKAGLLTTLSTGGCGVHPSAAGQAVLARAVERAVAP